MLIDADLIKFKVKDNEIIIFTIDGFLGSDDGLVHTVDKNYEPAYIESDSVVYWAKAGKDWYAWRTK